LPRSAGVVGSPSLARRVVLATRIRLLKADPLHLQVGVSIKTFANPDRHVDTLVNEIDPPIGYDTLKPQQWMGGKEARHGSSNRALESERAAQSNKPARFSLH
jgi:hypothetical protein